MLLIIGVLLWAAAHLFVAQGTGLRQRLIARLGAGPYRGLFSLVIVLAVILIVLGWRAMPSEPLYLPPAAMRHVTMLLMPFAVILFISARAPTDIKQFIRHPQLTGVKLWAVAHLLTHGETRAVILFGGLLAWAVAEVIVINRRDGAWNKPPRVGALKTAISAVVGLLVTAALMYGHQWFAGIPLFARG